MGLLGKLFAKKKMPVHLDDASFTEEVLQSDLPVIVDVWSPGCAPCKKLEEIMVGLATEYDGRVKVCELGTHIAPQTAAKLRISATPTVLYFQKGREKDRVMGFRGSLYHQQAIEELFEV
ncbi:MAG TPA: thioredoxin domain-containing protein [Polyangiaceae bacterium LLY-WYZ-15_(1-7)]|nr:thiol reductase thioredoxin [Myxococcales bacterium]MAT28531.1 thiol reductase thioredoxin [Sandaracinus sp.]HJK90927.1 thioredoxin domain-containing protein [Polyangiaceae bacterium LLY-WYZ-15_(1-7)]MBJ74830.1 thiol reductase thioredoxin [Sandaracinus sp.]HJL01574.1 thioredoxin domain-containing protein [Polyangiaceae bacterium LLY-WYZ-15_(1-7)]